MAEFRFPNITAATTAGQLDQIKTYLFQLTNQLNFALKNVEKLEGNLAGISSGSTEDTKQQPIKGLYGLGRCKQLTEGANADDCLEFRVYGVSPENAGKVGNLPEVTESGKTERRAGTLRVFSAFGMGMSYTESNPQIHFIQEYTTLAGDYVFRRYMFKNVKTNEVTAHRWFLYQQKISQSN